MDMPMKPNVLDDIARDVSVCRICQGNLYFHGGES